jgi:histidinol dehydrogenase/sulfopropanediol 3-dehydrogenase
MKGCVPEMLVFKEAKRDISAEKSSVEQVVREIVQQVRSRGDAALVDYTEKFDGLRLDTVRVPAEKIRKAYSMVSPEIVQDLKFAAERIRKFAEHQRSCLKDLSFEISPGVTLGHRLVPVESCGCYVPAGRYPLPSSALMSIIPAKVAGVKRVAACSPASRTNGGIYPVVLVAMDIAGVDEVYCMGGAQAIAAYAYGTDSVPPVDIIAGPGNRYVTEAKRQVSGDVGIDMLAGPSEVVIIADDSADPVWVAADSLARCEHDPNSWTILVTTSKVLAEKVTAEIKKQLETLKTAELAGQSWENNGKILIADSMEEAVDITNEIAPEHLQVMTEDSRKTSESLRNFGSLFIGHHAPVAFGDYVSGPNHILPTSRCSRFSNGVFVGTFIKFSSFQEITAEGAKMLSGPCARLAGVEGLFGHQRSAELRG